MLRVRQYFLGEWLFQGVSETSELEEELPVVLVLAPQMLELGLLVPVPAPQLDMVNLSLYKLISDFLDGWKVGDVLLEHDEYHPLPR